MAKKGKSRQEVDRGKTQPEARLGRKEYERELAKLRGELVALSSDQQTRRLENRIDDPRKIWKLSGMDLKSYSRWYDYSRARESMFAATDTAWAPWYVAHTDDKKRRRLNIISHLISQISYEPQKPRDVRLPGRQKARGYREPDLRLRYIPTPF